MNKQMIIPMKNVAKINKLLSEGWSFSHNVGDKNAYALLSKYEGDTIDLGRAVLTPPVQTIRYYDPQDGGF